MIDIHELAREELQEAQDWYQARSPAAAEKFLRQVASAMQRLSKDPASWPDIGRGYRQIRVRKFPYVLVFRIRAGGTAQIVAVAHTSRRPGYWRRRK